MNVGFIPGNFTDFENPEPYDDPESPHPKAATVWAASMRAHNTIGTDRWVAKALILDWDVNMDDIYDGSTNTLIYSENLQAGDWAIPPQGAGGMSGFGVVYPPRLLHGFGWLYTLDNSSTRIRGLPDGTRRLIPETYVVDMPETYIKINGILDIFPATNPGHARPTSFHPGTVNGGFAGGQVISISEQCAYHVYQSLCTPNNRRSDQPTPTYQLESKDYEP
jgi:hypothetical protein